MMNIFQSVKKCLCGTFCLILFWGCMSHDEVGSAFIVSPYIKDGYYTDGTLYFDIDKTEAVLIGSQDRVSSIVVPDGVKINDVTYPLTKVQSLGVFDKEAYSAGEITDNSNLKSVTFGGNVSTFVKGANGDEVLFKVNPADKKDKTRRFTKLTTIVVRNGNQTFNSREDCNALIQNGKEILILGGENSSVPAGVQEIGPAAFRGCETLTRISIPDALTTIGDYAFESCYIVAFQLHSGITSIGDYAFANNHLTKINIPSGVTNLNATVFRGNPLDSITVDAENLSFDSREDCNAVVVKFSNEIVFGCKNTTFPVSITAIGDEAFSNCLGMSRADVPANVTYIGKKAFYNCTALSNVVVYAKNVTIADGAFKNCDKLKGNNASVKLYVTNPSKLNPTDIFDTGLRKLFIPEGSKNAYQGWEQVFKSIQEF